MSAHDISDQEFLQFQRFIFDAAGISLSTAKKALVSGRLAKRLQKYRLASYGEYFRLLASGSAPAEVQTAVDLLTTNETYFFREPKHFDFYGETKRQVVARVLSLLKPGGYFLIGHSESLNDISDAVQSIVPSIYRKR